jgi:hypothetical protein
MRKSVAGGTSVAFAAFLSIKKLIGHSFPK